MPIPNDKVASGDITRDPVVTSTTDDVGGFFPWANLDGSKYRDYSASREKSRADARGHNQTPPPDPAIEARLDPAAAHGPLEAPKSAAAPTRRAAGQIGATPKLAAVTRGRTLPPGPRKLTPRSSRRYQNQSENSRWVALIGSQDPEHSDQDEEFFAPNQIHLPTLAFISLAGGTGKTSMVASIGCLLAREGIRTMLVDTHIYGLLPLFFGAREVSPGSSRTFGSAESAPVRVMTLDRASSGGETGPGEGHSALEQLLHHAEGVDRILIDVSTASTDLLPQFLPLYPTVLVVLLPDLASVVSLRAVQQQMEDLENESGQQIEVFYILNQFDPSLRLHRDVRERLAKQLGKRFLSIAVRRSNAVSEALADGMTVVDYAPEAQTTEDLKDIAQWIRGLHEPATSQVQDMRWGAR